MEKIIVIGGMAAGMSASSKAKRDNPDLEIVVYTQESGVSYGACGLPYYLAGHFEDAEALRVRQVEDFTKKGVTVKINHKVVKLITKEKRVLVKDLETGREFWDNYDKLVFATGSRNFLPPVPGIDLEGVFSLKTADDGKSIDEYLRQESIERTLIIGAGFIGLEVAESLIHRGKKVTILEVAPYVLSNFDQEMGDIVQKELEQKGIECFVEESVQEIKRTDNVLVVKTDKRTLEVDFVLVSTGVVPNSELAKEAGLDLGIRNAIRVNSYMETSDPNIYAAGDCATTFHRLYNKDAWIPLGTTANKQGRIVGKNLAGNKARFDGIVGTGIVKVFDLECARTGLNEREAKGLGVEFETVLVASVTKPGYYPGSEGITCKLIAEKGTGKILGGQILGGTGAGKRIDTLATAIYAGLTVNEIQALDLAYAPPFAPVLEAFQRAAKVLEKKI